MASNEEFFAEVQAAGALKHGILRRYPSVFAAKTGANAVAKGRVTLVDGYAGAGRYDSGAPGSPLLLKDAADRVAAMNRDVECVFIESKDKLLEQLCGQDWGEREPTILAGRCEDHLPAVLDTAQHRSLLVFLDPFGMAVSFDSVANSILQRPSRAPVEVLLHFSVTTLWRMAPAALSHKVDEARAERMAGQLDDFLGGDWWREIMEQDDSASNNALAVSDEYARRVREAANCRSITIDVRSRPENRPIYRLILFTHNGHGTWTFVDAAGHAYIDWLEHCSNEDFERQHLASVAEQAALKEQGAMSLFDDNPRHEQGVADRSRLEERTAATYVPVIELNLRRLLEQKAWFRLSDEIEAVYGYALGCAREKHVRAAVSRLVADGTAVLDGQRLVTATLRRP